ncbi:hypothetical protein BASA50_008984 [Batrachochytrium salamandrivorans]|uniref:Uncharacterized protein n=1 Tax=Batrachochytrium salamandrivorans TaxID=1357716 RepID=A0ABQ8F301_9FUNG|nr:hypothetical protein BASA50_008984 [Batrachochytrium salamandrivorans]KAH9277253.1 hypothetical protein BASA83_000118 [Batrachochytrium salamandrivorans]
MGFIHTKLRNCLSVKTIEKPVFIKSNSPSFHEQNLEVDDDYEGEAHDSLVQIPGFSISTLEIVPKESLPVKTATDKEPAAPAVDPPSDMAAEVNPAIQDDGATPTVTPIADVEVGL